MNMATAAGGRSCSFGLIMVHSPTQLNNCVQNTSPVYQKNTMKEVYYIHIHITPLNIMMLAYLRP
jgi:hypothetical protein